MVGEEKERNLEILYSTRSFTIVRKDVGEFVFDTRLCAGNNKRTLRVKESWRCVEALVFNDQSPRVIQEQHSLFFTEADSKCQYPSYDTGGLPNVSDSSRRPFTRRRPRTMHQRNHVHKSYDMRWTFRVARASREIRRLCPISQTSQKRGQSHRIASAQVTVPQAQLLNLFKANLTLAYLTHQTKPYIHNSTSTSVLPNISSPPPLKYAPADAIRTSPSPS